MASLKLKFRTMFPASVTASSPLTLVKTGLVYAFGLDITALFADGIFSTNNTFTGQNLYRTSDNSPAISVENATGAGFANAIEAKGLTNSWYFGAGLGTPDYGYIFDVSNATFKLKFREEGTVVDNLYIGTGATTPTVTYVGDSLTAGTGATNPYPFYITPPTYNGQTLVATNIGVGGRTVSQMADYANRNLTQLFHYKSGMNVAVVWGGINDLYTGATNEQVFSSIQALCSKLRNLGFKVVVCTLTSAITVDTSRATVNGYIRNNWTGFADALADLGANANIGGASAYLSSTYFNVDGIHLKDAGYTIVGTIVQAALTRVVNSPTYANATVFSAGVVGSVQGSFQIGNATAGLTTITNATNGGNPTIQTPNTGGTMAVSATVPLVLNSVTGNLTLSTTPLANSLAANVAMGTANTYFAGPAVAQGVAGVWFASGTVTLFNSGNDNASVKLWDGTNVVASATAVVLGGFFVSISVSGVFTSPPGNIRIDAKMAGSNTGSISFNQSGSSKDSTLTAVRIG